ncbi:MAG: hypothetical protein AVDCRST_MAG73-1057, partial [uncultured Thermomicrobiales bacterium]
DRAPPRLSSTLRRGAPPFARRHRRRGAEAVLCRGARLRRVLDQRDRQRRPNPGGVPPAVVRSGAARRRPWRPRRPRNRPSPARPHRRPDPADRRRPGRSRGGGRDHRRRRRRAGRTVGLGGDGSPPPRDRPTLARCPPRSANGGPDGTATVGGWV